jgi:DNA-binding transcriptional regulator YdaS (Cro superfamily)
MSLAWAIQVVIISFRVNRRLGIRPRNSSHIITLENSVGPDAMVGHAIEINQLICFSPPELSQTFHDFSNQLVSANEFIQAVSPVQFHVIRNLIVD